ncbi:MAG: hypothetical protein JWP12_1227 [Bacteroidetes bacterium]|nr:hypothetical protein [Bacteroidota bacterium]
MLVIYKLPYVVEMGKQNTLVLLRIAFYFSFVFFVFFWFKRGGHMLAWHILPYVFLCALCGRFK